MIEMLASDLLEFNAHRRMDAGVELADRLQVIVPANLFFSETFHCFGQFTLLSRRSDRGHAETVCKCL